MIPKLITDTSFNLFIHIRCVDLHGGGGTANKVCLGTCHMLACEYPHMYNIRAYSCMFYVYLPTQSHVGSFAVAPPPQGHAYIKETCTHSQIYIHRTHDLYTLWCHSYAFALFLGTSKQPGLALASSWPWSLGWPGPFSMWALAPIGPRP